MAPRRVIGIDAGGTKLLGGVVDANLVVHHRVHRHILGLDQAELVETIVDAVEEARAAAPDVEAVGFGIPALVRPETGSVMVSNHLPLDGLPFSAVMSERLDLPVAVDNDSNVAMLAEHRAGAARGARDAVMLTLGTGIGGGLLLRDEIYRGSAGAGAELGHIVVDPDGPDCPGNCPGRGCLEAFASGTAIGRAGAEAARRSPDSSLGRALAQGREITGGLVTELAHDGDELALELLAEAGRWLGIGLVSIVNALNPELVVVGGGAAAAGDLLLDPAREVLAERGLPPNRELVRVLLAELGSEAGMIGAALLMLEAK
ncbi:MAG TPA: ROK family protein [Thermoleophilaceae bacterium]|nr:ROK family protein [Thermoleophilaceae bacterium]